MKSLQDVANAGEVNSNVRCFNQVFKPEICVPGWGNCRICTADEKNKSCKGYETYRIRIYEFEVN